MGFCVFIPRVVSIQYCIRIEYTVLYFGAAGDVPVNAVLSVTQLYALFVRKSLACVWLWQMTIQCWLKIAKIQYCIDATSGINIQKPIPDLIVIISWFSECLRTEHRLWYHCEIEWRSLIRLGRVLLINIDII